jgi:hypothetical protein
MYTPWPALLRGLGLAATASLLFACAGTPQKRTDSEMARLAKSRQGDQICRYGKPTGSHIDTWICLTPQEDAAQRAMAFSLLQRALEAPWRP